eukprot:gnl/MRDRNA2_/MRDRNA2_41191_c0_seq1.p1 gnl/MRDRNA2_/MRDRNA2_41191_c0~~gnl/MRDRNA2_/MRDRNA2_41191_c0_seq1.p1  ORF type:complete len:134 (+),score=9.54 gnl/MRDRNA2_/MRDRNA2_41191_c0_seq1:79-480(+)
MPGTSYVVRRISAQDHKLVLPNLLSNHDRKNVPWPPQKKQGKLSDTNAICQVPQTSESNLDDSQVQPSTSESINPFELNLAVIPSHQSEDVLVSARTACSTVSRAARRSRKHDSSSKIRPFRAARTGAYRRSR